MKAIVEIKGGFGNQIFQYAFSNHLKNLGYKVSVNIQTSLNSKDILNSRQFGFKQANKASIIFFRLFYRIIKSNKTNYLLEPIISSFFTKFSNLKNFNQNNSKYLSHFDGYWQDMEIFTNQKEYIIRSLIKSNNLFNSVNGSVPKGSTLFHIRRGDYKIVNEELGIKYYQEALKVCNEKINNFSYEIFTDDPSWVHEQEVFSKAKGIHGPTDDLILDISKMLNFENYVISNSSFSLVIASISERKGSTIITPSPWMKNSFRELKINENWLKLKNY